jgi:UDP-N-acetylmuramate: L-alanyl-gamma-D-glutamyl-meso-diaminopimelate ligase
VEKSQKHVHIVGICGVATSALAIAFHNKGWKVTGSDKGFFPPVSTELEKAGIDFYAGWHPEKVGKPDIVIIGNASGSQNPETQYVKENNIPIISDAEARGKYFAKKNSVVCAGTWGKTSSTALLSHILMKAELDPSFVVGGIPSSIPAARLGDSEWSVIEGDEYKTSPWDNSPKFAHLKTTHLLLTAVSWDHADIYPTEESYFKVFKDLVFSVNFIIACKDDPGVNKVVGEEKVIWYGKNNTDYTYSEIKQTKDGLDFTINGTHIHSPMIGEFQAENITACFAMARELGLPEKIIVDAIATFTGLKRRLEKRFVGQVTVFDDIAHSPEKAASVLKNLRSIYEGRIMAIFEPNIGGRQKAFAHLYDNAFKDADTVIIPRLSKLKISENENMEGNDLAEAISKTHKNIKYIEDDEKLVEEITKSTQKGDVVVFLGSHGFRGMIESAITSLRQRFQ